MGEIENSGNTATVTPDEQQTLIIECRVIANPPAAFEWSRDDEILNSDSRVSINEFVSTGEPTSTSILTITNVSISDGGNYICSVENSSVSANYVVSVTGELLMIIILGTIFLGKYLNFLFQ